LEYDEDIQLLKTADHMKINPGLNMVKTIQTNNKYKRSLSIPKVLKMGKSRKAETIVY
jgi:glycosylphosphatidylinositol transamidase (GPIT) subunit GPI8